MTSFTNSKTFGYFSRTIPATKCMRVTLGSQGALVSVICIAGGRKIILGGGGGGGGAPSWD